MNSLSNSPPAPQTAAGPTTFGAFCLSAVELALLVLAPVAVVLIGRIALPNFPIFGLNLSLGDYDLQSFGRLFPDLVADELAAAWWIGVLPLLLLSRVRILPRTEALTVAALLTVTAFWLIHSRMSAPVIADIKSNMRADTRPDPWILVPVFLVPVRSLARLILPFAAGILLTGRDFRLWKFALGCLVSALLIDAIYNARFPLAPAPLVGSALLTGLACLPMILPRQRAALARICGLNLDGGTDGMLPPEPSMAFRAVSMTVVGALALIIPLAGIVGYVERRVSSVLTDGARPPHRSPALVNAHGGLKALFTKGVSKDADETVFSLDQEMIPNSFSGYVLPHVYTPEVAKMAIQKTSPDALAGYFEYFGPHIAAVESVRESDYCDYSGGAVPNFINIRSTARALAFRAIVRLTEGRADEAARDIDTLYRFATVLRTDGTLVQYMIGTAVVGIATTAAYEYYLWNRDQPEKLALLIKAMEHSAPRIHTSLDLEMLRRTEVGWWPVTLFPEMSTPGIIRAFDQYYFKWLEFDFVLVAMKLELHRHAHGAYPDSLDQLVPEYLDRVPLDPSDGNPWTYKNLGAEFELSSAMHEQFGDGQEWATLSKLRFPISEVDTPEAREAVEKWNPGAGVHPR